jgi:hypothetical protein
MRYRIFFLIVTVFFVTMNVLLWRSEFGAQGHVGTPVPPEVIWEKVLTCPDNSILEIRHKGNRVGSAHWTASISEELATGKVSTDELPPEGMINRLGGYTLDFGGNLSMSELNRLRFECSVKLGTNQTWQEFSLKVTLRPFVWEIHAAAAPQTLKLTMEDDEGRSERLFSLSDLRNPDRILTELGGPGLPATFAALGLRVPASGDTNNVLLGLKWEGRNDWIKVGLNSVRVYRLEARLLDRYRAILFVSPVGEILRVELPDDVILMNDALINL